MHSLQPNPSYEYKMELRTIGYIAILVLFNCSVHMYIHGMHIRMYI